MNKTTRKHWAKCTTGGGFTLAELLIVVAVIAVLVAVAIPTFGNQLEKSRQSVDLSNLRDAYAQAQLVILNQSDTDSILGGTNTTNSVLANNDLKPAEGTNTYYRFWYDPDSDSLSIVKSNDAGASAYTTNVAAMGDATNPTDTNDDKTVMGKATTASLVASLNGVSSKIQYAANTLKRTATTVIADNADTAGTVRKGIVVEFLYTYAADTFTLNDVTFVYQAKGKDTQPIRTGSGITLIVSGITPLTNTVTGAGITEANKATIKYDNATPTKIVVTNAISTNSSVTGNLMEVTYKDEEGNDSAYKEYVTADKLTFYVVDATVTDLTSGTSTVLDLTDKGEDKYQKLTSTEAEITWNNTASEDDFNLDTATLANNTFYVAFSDSATEKIFTVTVGNP